MIGRPNAQNKARKGVLRQSSGGAKRKPAQKQNSFSRARPNAQAALKPPNNCAARGGPKPPNAPNKSVGNRGAPTAMATRRILECSIFPDNFPPPVSEPDTLRRSADSGAPPAFPLPAPNARAASPHAPQKQELRIGRRADWATKAAQAKRRGPRPEALSQPFHSSPSPTQSPTLSFGDGPSVASQSRGSADGRRNKKRMKGARAETPRIAQFKRETAEDRAGDALLPMPIRPQGGERRKDKRRKTKDGRTKRPETGSVKKRHERGAKKGEAESGRSRPNKKICPPKIFRRHALAALPHAARPINRPRRARKSGG